MDWGALITVIGPVFTAGGVIYLIVDRLFDLRKNKAEVKSSEIHNGNDVADLYDKIDSIVERKTAPIKSELAGVKYKLEEITSTWVCYDEECVKRTFKKKKHTCAEQANNIIESIDNETKRSDCKD